MFSDIIHSDNHVHTYFSTDSDTPMEDMLKTLLKKNFLPYALLTIWIIIFHPRVIHLSFCST